MKPCVPWMDRLSKLKTKQDRKCKTGLGGWLNNQCRLADQGRKTTHDNMSVQKKLKLFCGVVKELGCRKGNSGK